MNVCGNAGDDAFAGAAGGCINVAPFDTNDQFDYSGALANTLEAGVPVTFYFGKQDTACNYVGGLAMADTIPWKGKDGTSICLHTCLVCCGVGMPSKHSVSPSCLHFLTDISPNQSIYLP